MRWHLRQIFTLLIGCLLLVYIGFSLEKNQQLKMLPDVSILFMEDNQMSAADAWSIRNEMEKGDKQTTFTAWAWVNDEQVENPALYRTREARILYLVGEGSNLLGNATTLLSTDKDGCLLSDQLSYELFGSLNSTGCQLNYRNKQLTVRGVFESKDLILAIQAEKSSQAQLNGFAVSGNVDGFISQNGLFEAKQLDVSMYQRVGSFFLFLLLLPPLGLLLVACFKASRRLKTAEREGGFPRRGAVLLVTAVTCFFLVSGMGFGGSIPAEFIPTRWSDLSFFGDLWQSQMAQLGLLLSHAEDALLGGYFQLLTASGMFAIGGGLLFGLGAILVLPYLCQEKGYRLIYIVVGLEVLIWLALAGAGVWTVAGYWRLVPVVMAGRFGIHVLEAENTAHFHK